MLIQNQCIKIGKITKFGAKSIAFGIYKVNGDIAKAVTQPDISGGGGGFKRS